MIWSRLNKPKPILHANTHTSFYLLFSILFVMIQTLPFSAHIRWTNKTIAVALWVSSWLKPRHIYCLRYFPSIEFITYYGWKMLIKATIFNLLWICWVCENVFNQIKWNDDDDTWVKWKTMHTHTHTLFTHLIRMINNVNFYNRNWTRQNEKQNGDDKHNYSYEIEFFFIVIINLQKDAYTKDRRFEHNVRFLCSFMSLWLIYFSH